MALMDFFSELINGFIILAAERENVIGIIY